MFDFHAFVKKGLLDAVNKQSNYWVMLNAAAYYEKGILTDEDMTEIQELIDSTQTMEEAQIEDMEAALEIMDVSIEDTLEETEGTVDE